MTYKVEYQADHGLITVTHQGETRYADVMEAAPEIARLMEEHNTHLVLIDLRGAAVRLSVPELYFVTRRLPELGVLPGCRLALVCPKSETIAELYDFYSLASRSRGYRTRLFETIEPATAWLREGPRLDSDPVAE